MVEGVIKAGTPAEERGDPSDRFDQSEMIQYVDKFFERKPAPTIDDIWEFRDRLEEKVVGDRVGMARGWALESIDKIQKHMPPQLQQEDPALDQHRCPDTMPDQVKPLNCV